MSLAITRAAREWAGEWQTWAGPPDAELAEVAARFRDSAWTWRR